MTELRISDKVKAKIAVRGISSEHIMECFRNRDGNFLYDDREEHDTDPPTRWFVAETNAGRILKVIFVPNLPFIDIKSAFDANEVVQELYDKLKRT